MYLNDMPLGQRGSFAIVGVAEASRLFFGKDVSNVTLAEAATIAGVLQSPSRAVAVQQPRRAAASGATSCCRRWSTPGFIDAGGRRPRDRRSRSTVVQRALEAEAPYFVDYVDADARRRVSRADHDDRPSRSTSTRRSICTCSALAQDAVRDGLTTRRQAAVAAQAQGTRRGGADRGRSEDRRDPRDGRRPLLQPVAVQPRDHGRGASRDRSSSRSSISRRSSRRPQAGAPTSRPRRSSTTRRRRGSSTTRCGRRRTTRASTTGRSRSAGRSRTRATSRRSRSPSRPATTASPSSGRSCGVGTPPKAYPSIALGVFEATPFEIATAYTLFPNMGVDAAAPAHRADRRAAART